MERKPKILLLITRGGLGGAQTSVLNLARELHKHGENVTVAFGLPAQTGDGEFLERECGQAGVPTHRLHHLRRSFNPIQNIRACLEMRAFFKKEKFDVVHINSSNALFAAPVAHSLRPRPKVVFTFRGLSIFDENVKVSLVTRLVYEVVMRMLLVFVDENVFVSNANYEVAKRKRIVHSGHVIYNGLDPNALEFLERENARVELSASIGTNLDQKFVIGSIGRLASQKNYEFLIEQMREIRKTHPHAITVIIGDGPERAHLESLIQKFELEDVVYLVGELPHAAQYMKAFDVFVLPSRYEGFSISLTEALFAGVPVLASDVGGAREQFSHAPEQVYAFNNVRVFQEGVARLVSNSEVRRQLSDVNRKRAQEFEISKTVAGYLSHYAV